MKAATKPAKMPTLQAALDYESYTWLAENLPKILEALEVEVARGVNPDDVHLYVLGEYGREELAQRLRQAARHMQRAGG